MAFGRQVGLPLAGEPAASGRAALLYCLNSNDIWSFLCPMTSTLQSGEELQESGDGG